MRHYSVGNPIIITFISQPSFREPCVANVVLPFPISSSLQPCEVSWAERGRLVQGHSVSSVAERRFERRSDTNTLWEERLSLLLYHPVVISCCPENCVPAWRPVGYKTSILVRILSYRIFPSGVLISRWRFSLRDIAWLS